MGQPTVIGALTDEERTIITERDRLRDRFFAAETEEERDEMMRNINNLTARYDAMRAERWRKGEVDGCRP
jgi:hypothetical protein